MKDPNLKELLLGLRDLLQVIQDQEEGKPVESIENQKKIILFLDLSSINSLLIIYPLYG